MLAKWRNRSDRWHLEAEVTRRVEKIGISPSHVMDALDLSTVPTALFGVHDMAAVEIDRQLRGIALDRPDLVRPGAALPFSPREIHDHYEGLIASGRTREAEALGKRFPQAIAQARPIALAEREAARVEAAKREWLAGRRLDALTRAQHAVAEEQRHLDTVSQGSWPVYLQQSKDAPPTMRDIMDSRVRLAAKAADLARIEAETAAASAAS